MKALALSLDQQQVIFDTGDGNGVIYDRHIEKFVSFGRVLDLLNWGQWLDYSRDITIKDAAWNESQHPRDEKGRFGEDDANIDTHSLKAEPKTIRVEDHPYVKEGMTPEKIDQVSTWGANVKVGDELYLALAHKQGFDGLPQVVSKSELDTAIASGDRELFRGETDPAYAQQFMNGDLHGGMGVYGSGVYTASGPDGREIAEKYAQSGRVLRMALDKDATVVTPSELRSVRDRYLERFAEEKSVALAKRDMSAVDAAQAKSQLVMNSGHLATMLGYDAIRISSENYIVVLNRTALKIQRGE